MTRTLDGKPEHEALYRAAIEKHGEDAQLNMVNEEAAELIVALNHYRRGRCDFSAVLEEIADLHVMLAQAMVIVADSQPGLSFPIMLEELDDWEGHSLNKLREKLI